MNDIYDSYLLCFLNKLQQFLTSYFLNMEKDISFALFNEADENIGKYCQWVQQIASRNTKVFNIQNPMKQKKQYAQPKTEKIQFNDGSYVYLTDNEVKSQNCILALHGMPADYREWNSVEKQLNKIIPCRWISLGLPGGDGHSEIRGSYQGSASDFTNLLVKVLEKKQIEKVILCSHSFGSILLTDFVAKIPHRVRGFINICGLTNYLHQMMAFYHTFFVEAGIYDIPKEKFMQTFRNGEERRRYWEKFDEERRQIKFGNVQIPPLNENQMISFVKFLRTFQNYLRLRQINKQYKMPKCLLFVKNDPVYTRGNYSQFMYTTAQSFQNENKLLQNPLIKEEIEKFFSQKYKIEMKAEELQEYFCYEFKKGGHNVHQRNPEEVSKKIVRYLDIVQVIEKSKGLLNSKL